MAEKGLCGEPEAYSLQSLKYPGYYLANDQEGNVELQAMNTTDKISMGCDAWKSCFIPYNYFKDGKAVGISIESV